MPKKKDHLRLSDCRFVLVEWIDSRGAGNEWTWSTRLDARPDEYNLCACKSVGWLALETKDRILLASHICEESDGHFQFNGEMIIPKVAVKKIHDLGAPEKRKRRQ